jgi:hypothetical protein
MLHISPLLKDTYPGNLSTANIPTYSSYYMALKKHQLKTRVIKLVVVIFMAGINCYQLHAKYYPISISQGLVHIQMKLLSIGRVGFDIKDKLLI